ncbi:MAG TPA: amylo-alpha-1,6-glucosidase [Planctomycetota bacterium]|jgi:predicted glycogen debranching enzyme|nr:amylo-alpha-1,6-glucosidase [Planctomycetota bacterium]
MPVPANSALLHFDRDSLLTLERSMTREWLETDGRGGYASSTILMCPTRRYHGLLVAPAPAAGGGGLGTRFVFLSRFEETLHGGGRSVPISMARYPGLWAPHGHQAIESFDLRPWPSFLYLFGSARIERDVLMAKSRPAVLLRYRVSGQRNAVELALRPLLPFREADALTFENIALDPSTERGASGIRCQPYPALPSIHIAVAGAPVRFDADPVWYRQLEYPADLARGYDGREDQFSPGTLRIGVESGVEVFVAASIDGPVGDIAELWKRETDARKKSLGSCADDPVRSRAAALLVADDFLFRTAAGRPSVIAGYPWFGEWGRDAFISLPGLLLARGEVKRCREALEGALPFLDGGLMPNIFGATRADSSYGSADASLWFARAVRLLEVASGSEESIAQRFLPALTEIARAYSEGTRLGIRSDEGGLVRAGSPEANATWMDAQTADGPVTPRDGCAVEIEALWYALLAHLEDTHKRRGEEALAKEWGARKRLAGAAFLERFWLPEGYLADSWKDGVVDRAMRPNMVIAAALEWSPLTREKRADVVRAAETELVVPVGLRTLEPRDPRYRGRFQGGPDERDKSYHQGTVWPWLLGFWCEAFLRAFGRGEAQLQRVRSALSAFDGEIDKAGLLHVSEVYDGDPPHRPGGTVAQAWNTAELLRAWSLVEEPAVVVAGGARR